MTIKDGLALQKSLEQHLKTATDVDVKIIIPFVDKIRIISNDGSVKILLENDDLSLYYIEYYNGEFSWLMNFYNNVKRCLIDNINEVNELVQSVNRACNST